MTSDYDLIRGHIVNSLFGFTFVLFQTAIRLGPFWQTSTGISSMVENFQDRISDTDGSIRFERILLCHI